MNKPIVLGVLAELAKEIDKDSQWYYPDICEWVEEHRGKLLHAMPSKSVNPHTL